MPNYAFRKIATCLFVVSSFTSFAQKYINSDSVITCRIEDLQSFWKEHYDITSNDKTFENFSVIPDVFKIKHNDSVSNNELDYIRDVNDAKLNALKRQWGLSGVAGYQENFGVGGTDPVDNISYHRRAYAGLDWNVLNNGFVESKTKQKIIKNEEIINSLKPKMLAAGNDYLNISHKIIYGFNTHKIELLEKRKKLIDEKISVAEELYLLKHLTRVDFIGIVSQQVDVESQNQIYKSYNDQLKTQLGADSVAPKNILPLFDIDVLKTFGVASHKGNDSITKLEIQNLELANKPINNIKVTLMAHYNYYNVTAIKQPDRNFISAGLALSVPIPMGIKTNKKLVEAQGALMEFRQTESQTTQEKDMFNAFYEFRYKLKQYNNFFEKRKKYEELIRIERVKEKFGDVEFNPLTALNLLDEALSVDVEMLDIEQQMYLKLLDISSKVAGSDINNIIKPYSLDSLNYNPDKITRGMYIWSDAQKKHAPSYIDEYFRMNKINTAFVSLRKDMGNLKETQDLLNVFSLSGIKAELLCGNNQLLKGDSAAPFFDMLTKDLDLKLISAIHLDVEPQTFEDWQANREEYLQKYVDLVSQAQQWCASKGLKLSVSIPIYYPVDVLTQIYARADNVYIMAYQETDPDFIFRKIQEEYALGKEKTVIALRAKDFPSRIEFENLIKDLNKSLHTTRFAMHDMATFEQLDENSVQTIDNKKKKK